MPSEPTTEKALDQAETAMDEEFDILAVWTADAALTLGPSYAVPAGCRGSGTPAALEWLGEHLGLATGMRLLDCGAGLGGPTALAVERFGVSAVLTDPMPGACRGAERLFGLPAVVAADQLPFADGAVDAAWSLAVLCTVEDKDAFVRELVRVVRPRGAIGLLVHLRTVAVVPDPPDGNTFPSRAEINALTRGLGLELIAETRLDKFPDPAPSWTGRVDELENLLRERHGDTEVWRTSGQQTARFAELVAGGHVEGALMVWRRP